MRLVLDTIGLYQPRRTPASQLEELNWAINGQEMANWRPPGSTWTGSIDRQPRDKILLVDTESELNDWIGRMCRSLSHFTSNFDSHRLSWIGLISHVFCSFLSNFSSREREVFNVDFDAMKSRWEWNVTILAMVIELVSLLKVKVEVFVGVIGSLVGSFVDRLERVVYT